MGLLSWITLLLVVFIIIYLVLFSMKAYRFEKAVNNILNFLMKERKIENFNIKQLIDNTIDFRLSFEKDQIRISETYDVSLDHAGCFLSNGGDDEYVCKEYNSGCKDLDVCQRIREGEVK